MNDTWTKGHDGTIRGQEWQGNVGGGEEVKKSELIEIPTPSARVLYRVTAIFPFDLFPDELVVDEIKVSVVFKKFLYQATNTMLIKDIANVSVDNNWIFGSLVVRGEDDQKGNGPLVINRLDINRAKEARAIIQGLMIYLDQKIDTSQMPVEEVVQKTIELGQSNV